MSPVESVFTRQGGSGTGLTGEWQGKLLPPPLELEVKGDAIDGVLFGIPGAFEVRGRFDGKRHPMTGPMVTRPSSASFIRSGPRSFRSIQYEGTKQMLDATFTVSDDGRTLTEAGIAEGGVKRTWVFDRVK
jgi:hypothetical protein